MVHNEQFFTLTRLCYCIWIVQSTTILIQLGKMGICNNKTKQKEIAFSTKAILQPQKFQKMSFYFSTQTLLRIDADCLVLYCDEKMNLNKNAVLTQAGKFQTRKIAEYAQAYLLSQKKKLYAGQSILFTLSIPNLRFRYACLACLKIWDGHGKIMVDLEKCIIGFFNQIQKSNIQSIAITEFNQQFGIPTQIGCKAIVQGLDKCKDWLKIVTFLCNDIATQAYYMEKINQNQDGRSEMEKNVELETGNRWSRQSSQVSNYF